MDYDFRSIEKRWQETWDRKAAYRVTETSDRPKYYVLDMFPYPSRMVEDSLFALSLRITQLAPDSK